MKKTTIDQPIPYAVTDMPIPFRVRVGTPSSDLRSFVVPRLDVPTFSEASVLVDRPSGTLPEERPSETRLKVA